MAYKNEFVIHSLFPSGGTEIVYYRGEERIERRRFFQSTRKEAVKVMREAHGLVGKKVFMNEH